jgi:hypothetical protein
MTAGQKKLLEICKKHIENNELVEAIEVINSIQQGEIQADPNDINQRLDLPDWMGGANPFSFLDNKTHEPCYVCKTVNALKELAAIHNMKFEGDGNEHHGVCKNCIDKIPEGFTLCGCGG